MDGSEECPFQLEGAVARDAATRELTIDVRAAEPRTDVLEPADEVIKLFALAVNEQLFTPTHPRASLELATEDVTEGGMRRLYGFRATAVPPVAFRALLSLLAQTHHAGDRLAGVAIRSAQSWDGVDLRTLLAPGIVAADRPPDLPFPLDQRIGEGEPGFCAITVHFCTRLPREQFVAIREGFNIWDHLVMLGAFKPDFAEQEDFAEEYGQTAHQTPNTVEHATPAYDGSAAALNAVVNLLNRVHADFTPIESTEIE